MKQIKIPELKSRHIPVTSTGFVVKDNIHWWKDDSPFYYPNVLINLDTFDKEKSKKMFEGTNCFLLTDSGGFQVVSGKCNFNWETSLLKQIELGATKIFAFDMPPYKPAFQGSLNQFIPMTSDETKKIIYENIEVAIKQSDYLRENYPEEFKKFCYIVHGKTLEMINYNFEVFKEKGVEYNDYFPGGIVFSVKGDDNLAMTIIARYAYEKFIQKGIYVHFLGMGSFHRMIILVRNKITTFDSSTSLQGARVNAAINPIDYKSTIFLSTQKIEYDSNFCYCPVCSQVDYKQLLKESPQLIGRYLVSHNLWHMLKQNVLLDSIPLNIYTEKCQEYFKIPDNLVKCLEFCDDCDKIGFDLSYEKYKHYLKKDKTKQGTLF